MRAILHSVIIIFLCVGTAQGQGNSGIFNGGFYDGFAVTTYQVSTSNLIFHGGQDDGFAIRDPQFGNTAGIYSGDSEDGFSELSVQTLVSSDIFSGGFYDGFGETMAARTANNSIFQGGNEDGFAIDRPNFMVNSIFNGLYYDGFAEASARLECTLITWIGIADSDWDNEDNWDIGRVPGACDVVIIDSAIHDPVITDGSLGIEFFSVNTIRRAKKLIIRPGGHLSLTEEALMDVASEVRVAGILSSYDTLFEPVVTLHEGGELTIKSGGAVELE